MLSKSSAGNAGDTVDAAGPPAGGAARRGAGHSSGIAPEAEPEPQPEPHPEQEPAEVPPAAAPQQPSAGGPAGAAINGAGTGGAAAAHHPSRSGASGRRSPSAGAAHQHIGGWRQRRHHQRELDTLKPFYWDRQAGTAARVSTRPHVYRYIATQFTQFHISAIPGLGFAQCTQPCRAIGSNPVGVWGSRQLPALACCLARGAGRLQAPPGLRGNGAQPFNAELARMIAVCAPMPTCRQIDRHPLTPGSPLAAVAEIGCRRQQRAMEEGADDDDDDAEEEEEEGQEQSPKRRRRQVSTAAAGTEPLGVPIQRGKLAAASLTSRLNATRTRARNMHRQRCVPTQTHAWSMPLAAPLRW